MRIAVIGAGNVDRALAKGWIARNHGVTFGVPDPKAPKYRDLGWNRLALPRESASDADVIVLATPWSATEAAICSLGDLSGRLVTDCTNPIVMGPHGLSLALGHDGDGVRVGDLDRFAAQLVGKPDIALRFAGADDVGAEPLRSDRAEVNRLGAGEGHGAFGCADGVRTRRKALSACAG